LLQSILRRIVTAEQMAKGQLRSNKEKKKPKQSKPTGPTAPFGSTQNKPSPPAPRQVALQSVVARAAARQWGVPHGTGENAAI
jgi:hypothetical protein